MADADLTVVVEDISAELESGDRELIQRASDQGKHIVAGNKCDLGVVPLVNASPVSALTGEGIPELRRAIIAAIAPQGRIEQDGGFITSLRHAQLLKDSRDALEQARTAATLSIP